MALPTTYLASENSAAERRSRALHRFIVGSPIFLLLAVGLVGHVHPRPYAHPASNAAYDRQIMAYWDRVVGAEALLRAPSPSTEEFEAEAGRWVAGYDSGNLVAVPPAVYEDHLRDSVRGEILRDGLALATELNGRAEAKLQEGRFAAAGRDALLAAKTARGLRGFDVQAFLQSLLSARRGLGLLVQAWPHLSRSERSEFRTGLGTMAIDLEEVDALVELDRRQAEAYKIRQKVTDDGFARFNRGARDASVSAATRSVRMTNARLRSLIGDLKNAPQQLVKPHPTGL